MTSALAWCAGPAALYGIAPTFADVRPTLVAPPATVPIALAPRPAAPSPGVPAAPTAAPKNLPPAAVWLALARRAISSERYEEALRCFDGAVSHEPRLAIAHLGRAVCLTQLGREKDAKEATEIVMDASRGQEEVLYALARMCAREGHTAIGVPLLRDAVRAIPELEEKAVKDIAFADHPAYLMAIGRM